MDVGCYCVSGCRLVAGDPVSVLAEQVTGETGVDMALYGTMRFWDDVVAQFEASFLAPERQFFEVVGDQGVLRAFAPWQVDWEASSGSSGAAPPRRSSPSSKRTRTGCSSRTLPTPSQSERPPSSGSPTPSDRRGRSTRSTAQAAKGASVSV